MLGRHIQTSKNFSKINTCPPDELPRKVAVTVVESISMMILCARSPRFLIYRVLSDLFCTWFGRFPWLVTSEAQNLENGQRQIDCHTYLAACLLLRDSIVIGSAIRRSSRILSASIPLLVASRFGQQLEDTAAST